MTPWLTPVLHDRPAVGLGLRQRSVSFCDMSGCGILNLPKKFARVLTLTVSFALASCGGRTSLPTAVPSVSGESGYVSPDASSPAALSRAVADAGKAGLKVKLLEVSTKSRVYAFPLSAHVVRSKKSLIVLAYDSLYLWPVDDVKLAVGTDTNYNMSKIPFHLTTGLDKYVDAMRFAQAAGKGRKRGSDSACADCAVIFTKSRPGKKSPLLQIMDAWQQEPTYSAWMDPALTGASSSGLGDGARQSMYSMTGGGGCDAGWTCYSYFYYSDPYYYSGAPSGGTVYPSVVQTAKGPARLTNCGTNYTNAAKQALAQVYTQSGTTGGNESGTAVYRDDFGNSYIVDAYSQGSQDSIDWTGTEQTVNGLTLVSIVHDHWGYEDNSTSPPTFIDYTVDNWQINSVDGTTGNHFSPADERVSENYGVPVYVELGTVQESFSWSPPPPNPDGSFNMRAPDAPVGKVDPNYHC